MRTEGGSPNLINGVSRQPIEVRLPSQLEESVNQFPTITRGLVPRNPAILKGRRNTPQPENATTHLIDRDDAEQYVVTVTPNGIEVTDLAGNAKTVHTPDGLGYLAGAGKGDLLALTVADHTFILNRRRVVASDPALSPSYPNAGLVHIVQGDYHNAYEIKVNDTLVARYATDGGPYADDSSARSAERGARTSVIANMLLEGHPPEGVSTTPANTAKYLAQSLPDWRLERFDNVLLIESLLESQWTLAVDAGSETKARAHKDTTTVFSELPRKAPHGFAIKVSGSEDTGYDDYFVRYDQPTGAAIGRWKETIAPAIPFRLDRSTMPHLLVRNADGTFTFKRAEYSDREVGDLETNPWPSFVGHRISELVFHKNRVGFTSGEATALSRHGDFFNFFIESILTPLDTDPIDVAISYPEASDIQYAVPYNGELIVFTKSVPFIMKGGDTMTPKSVNFDHLMTQETSSLVRPVSAGNRLFFANNAPSGTFVYEFTYDREAGLRPPDPITDHVNGYIPANITMMQAKDDLKLLVMVSENEPNAVYVYKWLWIGNEKAQSAWQKWTLEHPIVGMRFFNEQLVLVTSSPSFREIVAINCHEAWEDRKDATIFLDRRVEVTGIYNGTTNETTFTLPYPAEGAVLVYSDPDNFGLQPVHEGVSGNRLIFYGDVSGPAYAGFVYDSFGVLSELCHRQANGQGGYGNAVPGIETTVNNLTFETGRTVYLGVDVERDYRKPYGYKFSAAIAGTKTGRVGVLVVGEIKKTVSVMGKAGDTRIRFGNRGPYGYCAMAYRWTGDAQPIHY